MIKSTAAALFLSVLPACAAPQSTQGVLVALEPDCKGDVPTGSHIRAACGEPDPFAMRMTLTGRAGAPLETTGR